MRTVPRNKAEQISFFKTHLAKWAEHPEEIGTTAEIVAQLAAEVAEAEAAYAAQQRAENTKRSATARSNNAQGTMLTTGASVIGQIRSKARVDGNPVYALALISPPETPSPIAPPGKPSSFKASLDAIGCLTITWKCKNPRGSSGTTYQVSRQLELGAKFEFLGNTGERRFVDTTVPRGSADVTYRVQAIRSTAIGPVADFNVHLAGPGAEFAPLKQRQRTAA